MCIVEWLNNTHVKYFLLNMKILGFTCIFRRGIRARGQGSELGEKYVTNFINLSHGVNSHHFLYPSNAV